MNREIAIGKWYTRVLENAITCDFSIVDYMMADPQPEEFTDAIVCDYHEIFAEDYIDPIWGYDIGSGLLNFPSTAGEWYGA